MIYTCISYTDKTPRWYIHVSHTQTKHPDNIHVSQRQMHSTGRDIWKLFNGLCLGNYCEKPWYQDFCNHRDEIGGTLNSQQTPRLFISNTKLRISYCEKTWFWEVSRCSQRPWDVQTNVDIVDHTQGKCFYWIILLGKTNAHRHRK